MLQAVTRYIGRRSATGVKESAPEVSAIDPSTLSFTGRIAHWSARHRWWVVSASLLVVVLAIMVSGRMETKLLTDDDGEGEAGVAGKLIEDRFEKSGDKSPPTEQLVFSNPSMDAGDLEYRATVENLVEKLRALPEVAEVISYYDTGDKGMLSSDGSVVLARVVINTTGETVDGVVQTVKAKTRIDAIVDAVVAASEEAEGYEIAIAGNTSINKQTNELVEAGFARVMMVTLVLGMAILLIAFRAAVAAVIPLVLAVGAIIGATAVAAVVSQVYPLNESYSEMIMLMGMAVGIDYSLFIVSRFRSERKAGRSRLDAVAVASSTTGRAVFYAGVTVLLSLAGLGMTYNPIFISLAMGAIFVVMIALAASLTLLPALLAVLGDKVNWLRLPIIGRDRPESDKGGMWNAITNRVMARPAVFAAVTTGALIALALPLTSLNLGFNSGSHAIPRDAESRRAVLLLEEHFTAGLTAPAFVVVDAEDVNSTAVQEGVSRLIESVDRDPAYFAPFNVVVNKAGNLLFVKVPLAGNIDDEESKDAVRQLRTEIIPAAFADSGASVYVTGQTAGSMDFEARMIERTPYVFGFVLGLAFLLLLVMFRSVVIPVKAILLNLLSVGAAYGVLVIVFQWGWGVSLLGAEATGVIEPWLPLFLFGILFGLSMDYHMLLLNRIKEAYDKGATNDEAVASGIKLTASQITSAAAIMVGIFGAFALGPAISLQQFGLGLGVAVLIDATVIRTVLLPASMKLLGDWNWYLPSWLEWLPNISTSEESEPTQKVYRPEPDYRHPSGQLAPATVPIKVDR